MYDTTDLRSTLSSNAAKPAVAAPAGGPYDSASCVHFKEGAPQEEDALSRKWYVRGNNFVVCYVEARQAAEIVRTGQPDEYMILLPQHAAALRVTTAGGTEDIPGYSVVVVPPGDSRIQVQADCHMFLLFSTRNEDLAARAINAEAYAQPRHHVASLVPWPAPPAGYKLRRYSMEVADQPGRFGRGKFQGRVRRRDDDRLARESKGCAARGDAGNRERDDADRIRHGERNRGVFNHGLHGSHGF